jgi:hypothetical protein
MNGTGYRRRGAMLAEASPAIQDKGDEKGEYQKGLDKGVICDQDLNFREFGIDND